MPCRVTFVWRRCSSGSYERLSKRNTVWGTRFWEMEKALVSLKIHSLARKKINVVKKSCLSNWFIVSNISVNLPSIPIREIRQPALVKTHKQATLLTLMCAIQNHVQMWKLGSCASYLWISYHSAWGICNVKQSPCGYKKGRRMKEQHRVHGRSEIWELLCVMVGFFPHWQSPQSLNARCKDFYWKDTGSKEF